MSDSTATAHSRGWRSEGFADRRGGDPHRGQFAGWHPGHRRFLARLAGRSEQEVMTFMTIPSTISGGPSIYQVRVGLGRGAQPGDEADVLLAFYQHSYDDHISSLRKGASCSTIPIMSRRSPKANKTLYHHVGVPISGLTVEAIGGTARIRARTSSPSA